VQPDILSSRARIDDTRHPSARLPRRIRIGVYNASERYHGYTTGVGRHVNRMVAGLATHPDFDVTFMVPKDHWVLDRACTPEDQLFGVRSMRLPQSRQALQIASLLLRRPLLDKYLAGVDWIYSPREQLFATGSAAAAVTFHDVYHLEPSNPDNAHPRAIRLRVLWRAAVERAATVLTTSEFSKQRICEILRADASRVHVIGNGVEEIFLDVAKSDPRKVSPLPEHTYFLSIGGLSRKKGGHNILLFANRLEKCDRDARLVVIGPVEPQYAGAAHASGNILIIDRGLPDYQIARWIRGALAVLVLSEYEGFGIPALEAMAAGVPVIANDASSLPEVVGDAGLMIDAASMKDIDSALDIRSDPGLRAELIKRGCERVKRWRWDQCVDKLSAALRATSAPDPQTE